MECCYELKDSQSKCSPNTLHWKDFHFLQIASNFPQNKKDKYYNNKCNCDILKKNVREVVHKVAILYDLSLRKWHL